MKAEASDEGGVMTANPALERALELYAAIERDFVKEIEGTGVKFSSRDSRRPRAKELMGQLAAAGARVRNAGASVVAGPLSKGCIACTGSCVSRTFAITNNCHRDCFFCFNPNQKDFAYYCEHDFPWREQLDDLAKETSDPKCIALSGGEPMLMPEETCAFFRRAKELFPDAHLRIYTSGDLLDESKIDDLREAGLDEIRFSIKQGDEKPAFEKVMDNIALARKVIPTVMVEMPVIPGTEDWMKGLLARLDAMGVDGINLLEFTYAMWNWTVFEQLGLELRNPPFEIPFDYTYAGSLPVEGSEELCLELMLWALRSGLSLGMHYCSLENKHRAQVRNLNEPYADIDPRFAFDYGDCFLKTAVVYGDDRPAVKQALSAVGCKDTLEDCEAESLSFHPRWLGAVVQRCSLEGEKPEICVSWNVAVEKDGSVGLRELYVAPLGQASPVQLEDVTSAGDDHGAKMA